MSRIHPLRITALVLCLATAATTPAPAHELAYSVEVLVDGTPLAVHEARGTTYVEARKGREYAIRLTNRTGERVAVALAVDGLNSIDARRTSSRQARKWILAPWESVTLTGWQTGSSTARRFVFTSESNSYGAWLGKTSDLGVISAAFFRERPRRAEAGAESREDAMKAPSSELAATGIGREVEHRVVEVAFDEDGAAPTLVSLRYEYRDALVRLGVIPAEDDALARRERARGFAEPGFAPDPYCGRRCWFLKEKGSVPCHVRRERRSSLVSDAARAASPSAASATVRFASWSARMRSSTVSSATRRYTITGLS